MKRYAVTGTWHGAIIYANSEGAARRAFHQKFNGESITEVSCSRIIIEPHQRDIVFWLIIKTYAHRGKGKADL